MAGLAEPPDVGGSGRHIVLPGGQTTDEERDGWMHLSPRGEHDMPAPEHHPLRGAL